MQATCTSVKLRMLIALPPSARTLPPRPRCQRSRSSWRGGAARVDAQRLAGRQPRAGREGRGPGVAARVPAQVQREQVAVEVHLPRARVRHGDLLGRPRVHREPDAPLQRVRAGAQARPGGAGPEVALGVEEVGAVAEGPRVGGDVVEDRCLLAPVHVVPVVAPAADVEHDRAAGRHGGPGAGSGSPARPARRSAGRSRAATSRPAPRRGRPGCGPRPTRRRGSQRRSRRRRTSRAARGGRPAPGPRRTRSGPRGRSPARAPPRRARGTRGRGPTRRCWAARARARGR